MSDDTFKINIARVFLVDIRWDILIPYSYLNCIAHAYFTLSVILVTIVIT